MENAGVMLAYFDAKFNFLAVNSEYAKGSGYKSEELVGKNHFSLFPNPENKIIFEKVRDTGESVTFLDKPFKFVDHPERGVTYWDWTLSPVKDESGIVQGLVLSLFETTKRKKAEEEIHLAKKQWERTFDSIPDLVAILDNEFRIIRANKSMAQRLGVSPEQCAGLKCFKCVHKLDEPPSFCPHSLTIADGKEHIVEVHEENMGGDFLVSTTPLFGEEGQIIGSVHVARDITARKRMEQELFDTLQASQRRQSEVSALLEASKAVLQNRKFKKTAKLIFDSCRELIGAKAGYVALLNDEKMQNDIVFLDSGGFSCSVDPSLPMPIRGLRAEAYMKGRPVYDNNFSNSKYMRLMPKGHVKLKNVLFAPLTINDKTVGLIGIANKGGGFTDHDAKMALSFSQLASIALNNSRMMESLRDNEKKLKKYSEGLEDLVEEKTKKLRDAERLAAIGATAGMVGHDIRNPLQSIEGAVYLAKQELKSISCKSSEHKVLNEIIDLIEEQIHYIDHIIADLQDFAKKPNPQLKETDIQTLINESMSETKIPDNIKTDIKFQEDFGNLKIDPVFIKRVFTNLITNAIQSMPDGGDLTVSVSRNENGAMIHFKDTGVGIAEEHKSKIFTPLFTTKSKGQGFGLPVCKKFVEAHGGEISFESKEGKGTIFTVTFPIGVEDTEQTG